MTSPCISLVDILAATPAPGGTGPAAQSPLRVDGANLIVFTFRPGQSLRDHHAAHPIVVSAISGTQSFSSGGETVTLGRGTVVHLDRGVTHRVDLPATAGHDAVMLLILLTAERV
ncbi:hypothetical protein [Corynebacterium pacaense]|uniref:hypothetical protein n=1 Tax=Corynebacterium pacaense TaxID=1816684 RepID=UPI0009BBE40D|nr:hypothetical protein [Corynebacterium pacaense]